MTRQVGLLHWRWGDIGAGVALAIIGIVSAFPFIWMLMGSFTPAAEMGVKGHFLPSMITFDNYSALFQSANFGGFFLNSTIVTSIVVVVGVFLDSLGGFAFAKYKFPGKERLFWVLLATMMIPIWVQLVPLFILISRFNLLDSLWCLILPNLASAYGVFLFRQNIQNMPDAILESARIDGCSDFRAFVSIVLPVIRPALGANAILRFMSSWNAYLIPLIMMSHQEGYTIPLGLANMSIASFRFMPTGIQFAGSMMATAPIIIIFLLLQKQFIGGITMGASKE